MHEFDFLIIGSGAAAMSAGLAAASGGLDVLIVEKERHFGGASARSGGCPWIPNSAQAEAHGQQDSVADATTFLRFEAGENYDEEVVAAFLRNGRDAIQFIENHSPLRFGYISGLPDYHCDSPGGSKVGRVLYPKGLNGAILGEDLRRLRPPLKSSTFMSIQIGTNEAALYLTAGRKIGSTFHVAKRLARLVFEFMRSGRSLSLAAGNALIAGLAKGYFDKGGVLWTDASAKRLLRRGNRIVGAEIEKDGQRVTIAARHGVMIATGGFPHDSARRAEVFPPGGRASELWNMFPYGNSGDGLRMARQVGAQFQYKSLKSPIAFAPVIRLPANEGALETMPAFFNRGMPGVIAVTPDGKRFCNEARSYHDFCVALSAVTLPDEEPVAWFVLDHRALRKYGFGPVYPWPLPYRKYLRNGLLVRGDTIAELATRAGINADGLAATVERFNQLAADGVDTDFHRGSNAFDLASGDPDVQPNPCMGTLEQGPYYAVRVFAGCVGTFAGLKVDGRGRVLDEDGTAIAGLYAAGNDMLSLTGGDYVAGGCTIGPALTFGYIIGKEVSA